MRIVAAGRCVGHGFSFELAGLKTSSATTRRSHHDGRWVTRRQMITVT
jgi:hypothetical protein